MSVQFKAESFTCNGCNHTDYIAITSNVRISLLFRFYFKAESFTWTAPPPAWTPSGANDVRTVKYPVLNGRTNVVLRWTYTLGTGEFLSSTVWHLDGTQIAFAGIQTVISDNRFDVNKSEAATLIIKNVSALEDATIGCVVQTSKGTWRYNIRLEIKGEKCVSDTSDGSFLSMYLSWQKLTELWACQSRTRWVLLWQAHS